MDPLAQIALVVTGLVVWGYVTYVSVSAGVREGMRKGRADAARSDSADET